MPRKIFTYAVPVVSGSVDPQRSFAHAHICENALLKAKHYVPRFQGTVPRR